METAAAQMPWDKIISAAAGSPLGVVSLVILIAGGVAVLLFRNAGERTRLWVFGALVLGLGGVVVAVMTAGAGAGTGTGGPQANNPDHAQGSGQDVQATPETGPTLAGETPSAGPTVVAEQPEPAAIISAAPRIDGMWRENDAVSTYRLVQDGADVMIQGYYMGLLIAQGDGWIDGRQLHYSFQNQANGSSGDCSGEIAEGERSIAGSCNTSNGTMPFVLVR